MVNELIMSAKNWNWKSISQQNDATTTKGNPDNLIFLWVDANIDTNNEDCQQTLEQLHVLINEVNLFHDINNCIKFLHDSSIRKNVVMTSGAFGLDLVRQIHSMEQVDSIYVFCGNPARHEPWASKWSKIRGVHNSITPIYETIRTMMEPPIDEDASISFLRELQDGSNINHTQLEPSYMYTKLFKNILLEMDHEKSAHGDLVRYATAKYNTVPKELETIKEFEQKYRAQEVIWWYTVECFLYRMLNEALRLLRADIIVNMGFFIRDLHKRIEFLQTKQLDQYGRQPFLVYRGQKLSNNALERMKKTKKGLMSFNNFLSTTIDKSIARKHIRDQILETNTVSILFIMTIDPKRATTPFAYIAKESYYKEEEKEILFCMNTVFRIDKITPDQSDEHLVIVELTLTSDDDKELDDLAQQIEKDIHGDTGYKRLGKLLIKVGQLNKAEELYQVLLKQSTTLEEKAYYYYQLGWIKDDQKEYKQALKYYTAGLDIEEKIFSPTDPSLTSSYHNIGLVYENMGEYEKALFFYKKTLSIEEKTLSPDDSALATSYNNIGTVYFKLEDYPKALQFYEKAVKIEKKTLVENNPSLGTTYNNLGAVHQKMKDYDQALIYYEKALLIKQKGLPAAHPSLVTSYCNIAWMHQERKSYDKALSFYEKAYNIQKSIVPGDPVSCRELKITIENLKKHIGN